MSLKFTSLYALLAVSLPIVATAETPDLNTLNERYARCDSLELMTRRPKPNLKQVQPKPQVQKKKYKLAPISLNGKDIKVREALRLIGESQGANIVVSDEVKGTITLRLNNVPSDQALDIILQTKGLSMQKNGSVLYIASSNTIARSKKDAYSVSTVQKKAPAKKNNKAHVGLTGDFGSVSFGKAKTKHSSNTTLYGRVAMEYSYSSSSSTPTTVWNKRLSKH